MEELVEAMREWGRATTRVVNALDQVDQGNPWSMGLVKLIKGHLYPAIEFMHEAAEALDCLWKKG